MSKKNKKNKKAKSFNPIFDFLVKLEAAAEKEDAAKKETEINTSETDATINTARKEAAQKVDFDDNEFDDEKKEKKEAESAATVLKEETRAEKISREFDEEMRRIYGDIF